MFGDDKALQIVAIDLNQEPALVLDNVLPLSDPGVGWAVTAGGNECCFLEERSKVTLNWQEMI